jgi:hypothetical protein
MEWVATLRINLGASKNPVISADATAACLEAAIAAVSTLPPVKSAQATAREGRDRGPTHPAGLQVRFSADSRAGAEAIVEHELLEAAVDASLAALPPDTPAEMGWSSTWSVAEHLDR